MGGAGCTAKTGTDPSAQVSTVLAMDLEFHEDPAAFLDVAGEHLAAEPVLSTVVATVTATRGGRWDLARGTGPRWWLTAHDGGRVVGVAMRTAPFAPYPLYVLPMPDEAALALARALHERGEPLLGVNGALPAAELVGAETARLVGGEVAVAEHTCGCTTVTTGGAAASGAGPAAAATPDDLDLVLRVVPRVRRRRRRAGRPRGRAPACTSRRRRTHARPDRAGRVWLWEDEHGEPVHLTGVNPPAYGVARIGPVYTPREHRGRGYASAAVAEVSRMLLDEGLRVCLFTDQANPTSNRVYEALGYRPVVDMANLVVTAPGATR